MARYKEYDYAQDLMVTVNLQEQLLPGTLEHAINHLVDSRVRLEGFEKRYRNDQTGQKAYDPRLLLKIDLPESKKIYGRRMHVVETVFGNLRHNKGINRFTLRGKAKVNAQWLLYCAVHNIEKWAKSAGAELSAPILRHARSCLALFGLRICRGIVSSPFKSLQLEAA